VKFLELWRIAQTVYKEVSFQSIFSLRAGAGLPQRRKTDIKQLVRNAQISTLISKALTSIFIAVFGFTVFLPYAFSSTPSSTPKELAIVGGVSAFLTIVLFLIIIMGLQVSTSFVSSKITEAISPLPLSRKDISSIIFLTFIRIFDIPLIAAIASFLIAYALVGGTLLGSLICLVGICITEIFALTFTVGLSRFFYSRVAGGGGRSKWKIILRLAFMLVWIFPSFGTYIILNFGINIVQSFASLTQVFSSQLQFLGAIYPFSYGFLVSFATFSPSISYLSLSLVIASSLGYLAIAAYCFRWTTNTMRKIGAQGAVATIRETVKDTLIKPQAAWLGIIQKDLRVASRSPSFASLFLLPAIQTAALAMSFSSIGDTGLATALGVLTGVSIITLLLPPTLFSIEGLASSYTRSLPLTKRTLISSKTLLTTLTYVISLIVLFSVALCFGRNFAYILAFGAIHTFSVAAASMLELTILARKFWKEGSAMGNLYAKLSTYILILLPGIVTIFMPIVVALVTYTIDSDRVLPAFLAVAFSEFLVMSLIAFRGKSKKVT
jgi:predicted permease